MVLVSGPTALPDPKGMMVIRVRSALQMFAAVQSHFAGCDFMIAAAAVADYRVEQIASSKLKKQGDAGLSLTLIQNPDIVAWAAAQPKRGKVIAFAAETDHVLENAQAKLMRKGVDAVLANSVAHGAGFEQDDNSLMLLTAAGMTELGHAHKFLLAQHVWKQLTVTFKT